MVRDIVVQSSACQTHGIEDQGNGRGGRAQADLAKEYSDCVQAATGAENVKVRVLASLLEDSGNKPSASLADSRAAESLGPRAVPVNMLMLQAAPELAAPLNPFGPGPERRSKAKRTAPQLQLG